MNEIIVEDTSTPVTDDQPLPSPPKKRGRKSDLTIRDDDGDGEVIEEILPIPEDQPKKKNPKRSTVQDTSRGVMASDGALRRRDKIKSTTRYSPPPPVPTRRRKANQFPSTMSRNSVTTGAISIYAESSPAKEDGDMKKGRFSTGKEAKTVPLDYVKDGDGTKMVIGLPDGTTIEVPTKGSVKKEKLSKNDEDDDEDILGVEDEMDDDDYRPSYQQMKKMGSQKGRRTIASKNAVVQRTAHGMQTTAITMTKESGKTKVTYVVAPKTVTLTPAFKQPPKRIYGSQTKFIDDLPEIADCIDQVPDVSAGVTFLPDRVQLLHSDLPLRFAASAPQKVKYAFRHVLSPMAPSYHCLLCPQRLTGTFKSELELKNHYNATHELACDVATAQFADNVVFICIPESNLKDVNNGEDITVNSKCQYCDVMLEKLSILESHYKNSHQNTIQLIDQESILDMHEHLYCYDCDDKSFKEFRDLNGHYRDSHNITTFACKSCVFFTRDEARLKNHFKAKHMMNPGATGSATGSSSTPQCSECSYCNGVLLGAERMMRHIMTNHSIQTSKGIYSCTSCLEVAGPPNNLVSHSLKCPALRVRTVEPAVPATKITLDTKDSDGLKNCFICDATFSSSSACSLHLAHVHTSWVDRSLVNGQSDEVKDVNVSDLPSIAQLQEAKVTAEHGFYCDVCKVTIDVYPLYYLHMGNLHNRVKKFKCKVASCPRLFETWQELKAHIDNDGHPQKSVMEDTLGAICCHFCNVYFKDRFEFSHHHLVPEHNQKMQSVGPSSGSPGFMSGRHEARNFKCDICHTWFGLTDSFVYHMEHETHKYACPYCGIDFALPSSRRTHIQSHHQEKTDVCEICGIKQGSKERVLAHMVSHGVVFECVTCTKRFYQREQLNAHAETHGPIVECPWENCGKSLLPAQLSGHVKQHRIDKNTKCPSCNKVFSTPALLEAHAEVHVKAELQAKAIIASTTEATTSTTNGQTSVMESTVVNIVSANPIPKVKVAPKTKKSPQVILPKTDIPEGLKAVCRTCSQNFTCQSDLYSHVCPMSTPTKPRPSKNRIEPLEQHGPTMIDDSGVQLQVNKSQGKVTTYAGRKKNVQPTSIQTTSSAPTLQNEVPPIDNQMQTIIIQGDDGQATHISVPVGVDINEVLKQLGLMNDPPPPSQTDSQPQQIQLLVTTDGTTHEPITLNSATSQEQIIYMVDDGSCVLDGTSMGLFSESEQT